MIHRERILVKFSWISHSSNAIADHLTHQARAAGEDLVIWAVEEEEATSAIVQAVSVVKACWSCRHFTMMHDELPMICKECFYTNVKKGYLDPIEELRTQY